ncbi:hypothetical protein K0817_014050 [Microbacterium sp. HD4P20]|uniref:hypothetical protein n=1 Tax=Microbacterium sp. HD4P20 TaxID=2864874 RepID=UPI0020A2BEC3|nr:hypothetical protein [Microbacterium sp. HD4P20]MCP2637676.1 hypothetical protein [Microbacterium sp. HD4P20]
MPGSRRAKLTPAPGTTAEPTPADAENPDSPAQASGTSPGPNDERLKRDVPPHY